MGHSAGRKIENLFFIFLPPALLLLRGYYYPSWKYRKLSWRLRSFSVPTEHIGIWIPSSRLETRIKESIVDASDYGKRSENKTNNPLFLIHNREMKVTHSKRQETPRFLILIIKTTPGLHCRPSFSLFFFFLFEKKKKKKLECEYPR